MDTTKENVERIARDLDDCAQHATWSEEAATIRALLAERDLALQEVKRLNDWADGFSNAQLEERRTGELYQRELRAERDALKALCVDMLRGLNIANIYVDIEGNASEVEEFNEILLRARTLSTNQ